MSVTLHTNLGDIKCEIACDEVPKAAENFLALCASGYYDGTIFHRNIKGFMIQGGDPIGTGKGGTSIWGKKFNDEIRESLKHNARGILSMANSGPNTNGSQFFITYAKQPHLNGLYTIFGKVIHGFEVLDIMEKPLTASIYVGRVFINVHLEYADSNWTWGSTPCRDQDQSCDNSCEPTCWLGFMTNASREGCGSHRYLLIWARVLILGFTFCHWPCLV